MLCTRLYVEPIEGLMGQARKKRLLSLTNIVIKSEIKPNFHSDFSFGFLLSHLILLYIMFCTVLDGTHFSSKRKFQNPWILGGVFSQKDLKRDTPTPPQCKIYPYITKSYHVIDKAHQRPLEWWLSLSTHLISNNLYRGDHLDSAIYDIGGNHANRLSFTWWIYNSQVSSETWFKLHIRKSGSVSIEAIMAQNIVSWKYCIFNIQKFHVLCVWKSYLLCVVHYYPNLTKIATQYYIRNQIRTCYHKLFVFYNQYRVANKEINIYQSANYF